MDGSWDPGGAVHVARLDARRRTVESHPPGARHAHAARAHGAFRRAHATRWPCSGSLFSSRDKPAVTECISRVHLRNAPAICSGDQFSRKRSATYAHSTGCCARRHCLGRLARRHARSSASTARYCTPPRFLATSRLIVEAGRPIRRPMARYVAADRRRHRPSQKTLRPDSVAS